MDTQDLKKYFDERLQSNSIGHAYLFSNTEYENIKDFIEYICNAILFNNIGIENNPDLYIIEPEKNIIKKEKILDLEKELSKISQINNNKLYIIKECEKLNSSAANCLLKTLEEPEKNVYAFLITSNIDSVMLTVKSRCQILQCESKKNNIIDKILLEKVVCLAKSLEKNMTKSMSYNYQELYKNLSKDELKELLDLIELFYKDCLNQKYNLKIEIFSEYEDEIKEINKNNNDNKILKKIKILNDNITLLKYNLNGNLFIDKFLIEFGRI
jgi:DNA polymerase III delta prime subunit